MSRQRPARGKAADCALCIETAARYASRRSRQIYVRARTDPQSAQLWWPGGTDRPRGHKTAARDGTDRWTDTRRYIVLDPTLHTMRPASIRVLPKGRGMSAYRSYELNKFSFFTLFAESGLSSELTDIISAGLWTFRSHAPSFPGTKRPHSQLSIRSSR